MDFAPYYIIAYIENGASSSGLNKTEAFWTYNKTLNFRSPPINIGSHLKYVDLGIFRKSRTNEDYLHLLDVKVF
jgi:hypothetical protein